MKNETVYICESCGERFALEEGKVRRYEEGDIIVCPCCGSADLEEAERCRICGSIIYEHEKKGGVCKACFEDAASSYKHCLDYLQPWEREALDDHFGNIDITEREE